MNNVTRVEPSNQAEEILRQIFEKKPMSTVDKKPEIIGLPDDILYALRQPFPNVKDDMMRPTDGFRPRYIDAVDVLERLDAVLNGSWSFEVIGEPNFFNPLNQNGYVFVKGSLTIYFIINGVRVSVNRQQFGQCALEKHMQSGMLIDPGSNLKAAATDALKKCASLFGIGRELYMNNETPMQGLQKMADQLPQTVMMPMQPQAVTQPHMPASPTTIQMFRQLVARTGNDEAALCGQYGVRVAEQMSEGGLITIMNAIGGVTGRAAR